MTMTCSDAADGPERERQGDADLGAANGVGSHAARPRREAAAAARSRGNAVGGDGGGGDPRSSDAVDRHIGARIRERRVALGLTLAQLAASLGISEQQAQKYERGLNRVSAGRLYAAARALGAPVAWFFEGLGPTTAALAGGTAVRGVVGPSGASPSPLALAIAGSARP